MESRVFSANIEIAKRRIRKCRESREKGMEELGAGTGLEPRDSLLRRASCLISVLKNYSAAWKPQLRR
jgi:hypothetical protein